MHIFFTSFIASVMSVKRQKKDHRLKYLITWATARSSLQTLLLRSLIPSFIIALLKLHSIIDFLGAVCYATALPLIKIGVLSKVANLSQLIPYLITKF